jgi:hypothetical protein
MNQLRPGIRSFAMSILVVIGCTNVQKRDSSGVTQDSRSGEKHPEFGSPGNGPLGQPLNKSEVVYEETGKLAPTETDAALLEAELLQSLRDFLSDASLLNVDSYEKVTPGMTKGEVEELLGGPPGHYGKNKGAVSMTVEGGYGTAWTDDHNSLEFLFDENDILIGKHKRAGYRRFP